MIHVRTYVHTYMHTRKYMYRYERMYYYNRRLTSGVHMLHVRTLCTVHTDASWHCNLHIAHQCTTPMSVLDIGFFQAVAVSRLLGVYRQIDRRFQVLAVTFHNWAKVVCYVEYITYLCAISPYIRT